MAKITKDPDILGGKPCIEGHRVSVLHIWDCIEAGQTAKEITDEIYPWLTREEVHAALMYIHENAEEVCEMREERNEFVNERREEKRTRL